MKMMGDAENRGVGSIGRRPFLGGVVAVFASGLFAGNAARSARAQVQAQGQTQGLQLGYYSGTTSNVIRYYDPFGQVLGERGYQHNVLVRVGSPAIGGGLREANPFNLYVIPDPPSITGQEGVFEIHSALGFSEAPGEIVASPITGEPVPSSAGSVHVTSGGDTLFQYWRLEHLSETEFGGTLVDPHDREALTINLINAANEIAPGIALPWPYPMAAGTELLGASDGTNLQLVVRGFSIDLTREFVLEVQAVRIA